MASYVRSLSGDMKTLLIAACVGAFIMPLMSTMMNLALVSIGNEWNVGAENQALVNTVFLLGSVASMVPLARISDIVGRKKIFIMGLLITAVCSIVAAFSPNFIILLIMRFGMGAGSAAVSITSVAMLTEVFPFERRGWAIGIQTACIYVGSAVGPAFGGIICQYLGWRAIFFLLLPFTTISLISIFKFKRELITHKGASMDIRGATLFTAMVMVTMIGVINLPNVWTGDIGISTMWAPVLIIVGTIMLFYFVREMRRTESPVLDFNIFRYKVFSRSCIAAYMNYASSYSVAFFMALYLQSIGALSPMEAGLIIMIQPAIQVVLTAKFGSKSDRMKDKRILPTLGMAITGAGVLMIIFFGLDLNLWYVVVTLAVLGVGYGVFAAPNTNVVMSSVPPKNRGEASGMIALVRQLGMMTSMTIAMCSISLMLGSTNVIIDSSNPEYFAQFVTVLQLAFGICLVMCIIGTTVSWFRGKNPENISEFV